MCILYWCILLGPRSNRVFLHIWVSTLFQLYFSYHFALFQSHPQNFTMPPKDKNKRQQAVERNFDGDTTREYREESTSSEDTTVGAGPGLASVTMTSEHLDRLISSLVARIPAPSAAVAPVAVPPVPRAAPIKLVRWSDEDIPSEFFKKYEKAMGHNRHDKREWGSLLPVYLTGRAQAAFAQVAEDDLDDWDIVKECMLESLGDTPSFADRKWWSLSRLPNEDVGAFYLRIRSTGLRRLDGLKTKEEVVEHTILSRFMSLLSQDCYASVADRRPKDGQTAARMAQEWEDTHSFPDVTDLGGLDSVRTTPPEGQRVSYRVGITTVQSTLVHVCLVRLIVRAV